MCVHVCRCMRVCVHGGVGVFHTVSMYVRKS